MTDPGQDRQDLKLLAGAVAGHTVLIADGGGDRCWCDGESIFLPGPGPADEHRRDAVVLQAALLAIGSFDPRIVAKTTGRRRLRLRYLTLEALRAVAVLGDVVPRAVARRVREVYDRDPPSSAADSLRRAKGGERVPEAPAWMGTVMPGRVILNAGNAAGGTPSAEDLANPFAEDRLEELDDEEESGRSKILELLSAPVPTNNPFADALQKFLGAGRSPASDGAGGEELAAGGSRAGRTGANAQVADAAATPELHLLAATAGRSYPEWDHAKGGYRPDHCTVHEYDPPAAERPSDADPGRDPRLLRQLARLGLAPQRHRRQPDGDALDATALVEHMVDRATGGAGEDRVYELKSRTAHDLGVIVLLDITGSTGDAQAGRRVFDDQREIAARLIANLEELGDRVAGYGFQSWGRGAVRFLRIKEFDDRWDAGAQARLAAMEPGGFTRLGAAVRHATYVAAEKAGTVNTLVVVVGDGLPYDDGYEDRYAREDSRKAISEAVAAGVGCACISVKTATDEHVLDRVWGHVPHLLIDEPGDLADDILPTLRRSLGQAVLMGRDGRG
jgi:nitric oxide reductase NorD protein